MAALEYLIKFKQLCTQEVVPPNDPLYDTLISSPTACQLTNSEFYSNVPNSKISELSPSKLEAWLQRTTTILEQLIKSQLAGTPGALGPQLNSCCRIITRLCIVMYKHTTTHAMIWHTDVGVRILECLIKLMHFRGYTIDLSVVTQDYKMIWHQGIGSPQVNKTITESELEARLEVLRAFLSLLSEPLNTKFSFGLDYLSQQHLPFVFCSLFNFGISILPNENWLLSSIKQHFTANQNAQLLSLSLLLLVVTHLPLNGQQNKFRRLLSKISLPNDLEMISQKLSQSNSILTVALAWELVQANKQFANLPSLVNLGSNLCRLLFNENKIVRRLSSYTLISLTSVNVHVAQFIGVDVFKFVLLNVDLLNHPNIHLASVVDILYNCSPNLKLTSLELNELNSALNKINNPAVLAMFSRIVGQMGALNPSLKKSDLPFEPINFQWDETRMEWYHTTLWGEAVSLEFEILNTKQVRLGKYVESIASEVVKIYERIRTQD